MGSELDSARSRQRARGMTRAATLIFCPARHRKNGSGSRGAAMTGARSTNLLAAELLSREVVSGVNRLVKALREAEQLRVQLLAAARQAAWEAAAQKERAAREVAVLRTQAEMALARNLWWPSPPPDGE